jgi:peptide/nickel transport system substrate-binding protein
MLKVAMAVAILGVWVLSAGCRRSAEGTAGTARARVETAREQRAGAGGDEGPAPIPACPDGPTQTRTSGGRMTVLLEHEPPHLDPLEQPTREALTLLDRLIYEPLVECRDGRVDPALAVRWEAVPQENRLHLELRPDLRWHDGVPVTAADVQASIEAFSRGRSRRSVVASALADVVAVDAQPGGRVRLRLRQPWAGVLAALCEIPIVPAALARSTRGKAGQLRERPVGTGAYRLVEWARGRQIRLQRNPTWWRGPAALEEMVFDIEPDGWRGLQRARRGEVDLMPVVPAQHYPEQLRPAARAREVELGRVRDERHSFLALNPRVPALADPAVRRALSLLWNRQALSQEVHQGLAEPAAAPFGALPAPPFDPKLAERTLTQAGWLDQNGDGVRERQGAVLRLGLLQAEPVPAGRAIEIRRFSSNLARAGIRLEVSALDPAALLARVRAGDFDLAPMVWRGRQGEDPGPMLGQGGHQARGSGSTSQVQALLAELRAAETPDVRPALFARLAVAIAKELPVIYLYRHDDLVLHTRRVRGLCQEGGRLDLRGVWLDPP